MSTDNFRSVTVRSDGHAVDEPRQSIDERVTLQGEDGQESIVDIWHGSVNSVSVGNHVDEQDLGDLSTAKPFGDMTEMMDAMSDPRYRTSDAYRVEVHRRLMAMK